ncbi:sensor histidine kinase [Nocardiopsis sp. MG754419]|uniref:sensor histidine kinase n=1 Tax=Nocardiopsis sp. MG754419 TaxID=2259865 RepID=UPI001BAD7B95|nr:histidine kinase [Nocardiopsis sp. MG754419]MBR8742635.1 two-component sensor histidine kinase [Nocardiopsis sp. MG754419]
MSDTPLVGARRFETYVRWTTYVAVTIPAGTLLRSMAGDREPTGMPLTLLATVLALSVALSIGNMIVTKWSIDVVAGRPRRLPLTGVIAWVVVLMAFVGVTFLVPLPGMGMTVAAAIGASAASVVSVLDSRRAMLLNAAALALAVPLVGVADIVLLLVGAFLITAILWLCWASAWMLRVLRELQAAHEDRAALALANERLRISRDLHDVFGRTLATIAVKSSLASELAGRGHGERAAAEITEVRRLAEEAGTEVRHVVRGELATTWSGEVSGARSLLGSAGIDCVVTGDPVPEACASTLAMVVREGVTNVLRHSSATRVTIATTHEDGEVLLTLANDGIGPTDAARNGVGTGLRSMTERVEALGGHLTTRRDGDWFLLDAMIPLPKGDPA